MAFTREELIAEAKRRGLQIPPQAQPKFSREELLAEAKRRGLQIPQQQPQPQAPSDIPIEENLALQAPPETQPEPSLGKKIAGAGEAALSTITGLTGGAIGGTVGFLEGITEAIKQGKYGTQEGADIVENAVARGASRLTYEPKTEAGSKYTSNIGETLEPLQALGPFGVEILGSSPASLATRELSAEFPIKSTQAISNIKSKIADTISKRAKETGGAAGADVVERGILKQLRANELPVPIKLTKGQRTGEFGQRKFEKETAKEPELGKPLRERFNEDNIKIVQNLDAMIDQTGAEAYSMQDIGFSVDRALKKRIEIDKAKINKLYADANNSDEANKLIELPAFIQHLNETRPQRHVAPILNTIRDQAIELGAATPTETGLLSTGKITAKNAELLRQGINSAINPADAPSLRQGSILKGLLDSDSIDQVGPLFKRAQRERARFGENYENIGLIKRLTSTKPNSSDRVVAIENVIDEIILRSPVESVKQLRRVLRTGGEEGQQAWRDIQGGTVKYIRDQAIKNIERDENGNPVPSAAKIHNAIESLDKGGKLDEIFTKKGAEIMRTLDEVSQDIMVYPKDAVNWSNTASQLLAYLDTIGTFTLTGGAIPAPAVTLISKGLKGLRNQVVKRKVREALK